MALQHERNTWGFLQFVIALILTVFVISLRQRMDFTAETILRERLFYLVGAVGALSAGWFGYASYPRVHNFKVYAMGLGVAVTSVVSIIFFMLLPNIGTGDPGEYFSATVLLAYLSFLFVFLITVIVPEYLGYHFTRRMTVVIVGIIVVWFVVGISVPVLRRFLALQLARAGNFQSTAFWGLSSVAAAVIFLSLFTESHSLGIGGIHAGSVVLLSLGWLLAENDPVLHGIVMTALPFPVAAGTLIHWFRRLENRASYDPLLRIYNREWCERVLRDQSALDTRPPCAIALIDLDHFKKVNDTYGHDAGDAVLRDAAQRIRAKIVPDGMVGRFGGEELFVIIPRYDHKRARPLLERVRLGWSRSRWFTGGKTFPSPAASALPFAPIQASPLRLFSRPRTKHCTPPRKTEEIRSDRGVLPGARRNSRQSWIDGNRSIVRTLRSGLQSTDLRVRRRHQSSQRNTPFPASRKRPNTTWQVLLPCLLR